jgi:thermolabile hemolysin
MKNFPRWCWLIVWIPLMTLHATAGYSSLYVFGDSLSAITGGGVLGLPNPPSDYFNGRFSNGRFSNGRFSNGRVWVEYLADEQGIGFDTNKNYALFGQTSQQVSNTISSHFSAPADASTSLFIVWSVSSDCFFNFIFHTNDLSAWNNGISNSMSSLTGIIDLLYNDGARTLIMPNAVDVTKGPAFIDAYTNSSDAALLDFVHAEVQQLNTAFATAIQQGRARHPDLTIYAPDLYAQFAFLVTHPALYGLTKTQVDALDDPALTDKSFAGPGADYLFWDGLHPTTKVHGFIANVVQELISPVRTSRLSRPAGSDQFDLANLSIGRIGILQSTTNLIGSVAWTASSSITVTGATQTLIIPDSGLRSSRFFRLMFGP